MRELRRITDRVVQKYLTHTAIEAQLGTAKTANLGDDAQYAFCLTLKDLIQYHEACCATANGDPKRVYQIIIVRHGLEIASLR